MYSISALVLTIATTVAFGDSTDMAEIRAQSSTKTKAGTPVSIQTKQTDHGFMVRVVMGNSEFTAPSLKGQFGSFFVDADPEKSQLLVAQKTETGTRLMRFELGSMVLIENDMIQCIRP